MQVDLDSSFELVWLIFIGGFFANFYPLFGFLINFGDFIEFLPIFSDFLADF